MTATPKQATIVYWFLGAAGLFFARALLFSTWLSRAPEVQQALSLGTAQMGLLVMLFPLGGLAGILFANSMMVRLGSTAVGIGIFSLGAVAIGTLGFSLEAGNVWLSAIAVFAMGLPMAIADFLGNFEGTAVDRLSNKSLFPAIHSAFGIGMLLGAGGASLAIDAGWTLSQNYLLVAVNCRCRRGGLFPSPPEPGEARSSAERRRAEADVRRVAGEADVVDCLDWLFLHHG